MFLNLQLFVISFLFNYFYSMDLHTNISIIRQERGFKQIEVANHIGVDKSAYSKIEKGVRSITVEELHKMAGLFNMTTDQIINFNGTIPKEISIEDKSSVEQIQLIQQLDEDDKQTVFKIINKMLTNKKFKDFFDKNVATL